MEKADRYSRFKAALVDHGSASLLLIPGVMLPIADGPKGFFLICFLLLVGYQSWLIAKTGQSVGKKLVGIKIVRYGTDEHVGFVRAVLVRWWVNGLISQIPIYFIIDSLFIFREDQRCVHDHMAGTEVVKA
jgi:uncharacterized RDD family membrane protein YckC